MSEPKKMRAPFSDDEVRMWCTRNDRAWAGPVVFQPLMRELLAYRELHGDIDAPPKSPQPVAGDCTWLGDYEPSDLALLLTEIAALRAEVERRDEIIACEKGLRSVADQQAARLQEAHIDLNLDIQAAKAEAARYRAVIVRCLKSGDDEVIVRYLALSPDRRGARRMTTPDKLSRERLESLADDAAETPYDEVWSMATEILELREENVSLHRDILAKAREVAQRMVEERDELAALAAIEARKAVRDPSRGANRDLAGNLLLPPTATAQAHDDGPCLRYGNRMWPSSDYMKSLFKSEGASVLADLRRRIDQLEARAHDHGEET